VVVLGFTLLFLKDTILVLRLAYPQSAVAGKDIDCIWYGATVPLPNLRLPNRHGNFATASLGGGGGGGNSGVQTTLFFLIFWIYPNNVATNTTVVPERRIMCKTAIHELETKGLLYGLATESLEIGTRQKNWVLSLEREIECRIKNN